MDFWGLVVLFILAIIAVLLIAPFVALARANRALERIRELESEIRRLNYLLQRAQETSPPPQTQQPAAVAAHPVPAAAEVPVRLTDPVAPTRPAESAQHNSVAPPPAPPYAQPAQASTGGRSTLDWEMLIGRNVFNRVGVVALLFGLAFLLKYAFDHDWISKWMLVCAGFACGAALTFAGSRMHRTGAEVFAQGLMGAGVSILYLSVYASFNLYHLIGQAPALVLMCLVTVVAFCQAIGSESLAVAVLALVGGFITPVLLGGDGGGSGSGFGLLAYLTVLDIGLLAVALRRDSWAVIEPLTLAGTCAVYAGWRLSSNSPAQLAVLIPFLVIVWLFFYSLDLYRTIRGSGAFADLRIGTAVTNSLAFYIALYAELQPHHQPWIPPVTLLIGAAYLAALLVVMRRRPDAPTAVPRYSVTAIALLVIATGVQFRHSTSALASLWAAEATALVWCGLTWRMRAVWGCGVGLVGIAAVALLADQNSYNCARDTLFVPVANPRFVAFAVLAAACAACALLFEASGEKARGSLAEALHGGWCILLFIALTVELSGFLGRRVVVARGTLAGLDLEVAKPLAFGLMWCLYSVPVLWSGLRRDSALLRGLALAILALGAAVTATCGAEFRPLEGFHPITNARGAAFAMAAGCISAHKLLLARSGLGWAPASVTVFRVALSLLIFELISVETWDSFGDRVHGADASLRQMALSMVWILYSVLLMAYGIARRVVTIRFVAIGLFELAILKVFIYDLSSLETLYRIFSFIALGLILLGTSYLYQRYKGYILGTGSQD